MKQTRYFKNWRKERKVRNRYLDWIYIRDVPSSSNNWMKYHGYPLRRSKQYWKTYYNRKKEV